MKQILVSGSIFLIDDDDFDMVSQHKWYLGKDGYAETSINGKTTGMQRFILNIKDKNYYADHVNGNKLDNRRCNLRKATSSQNQMNKKPSGVSKYLGVSKHTSYIRYKTKFSWAKGYSSHTSWKSQIKNAETGKYEHLGVFPFTAQGEIDAAKAYDKRAKEVHREFARLNFPLLNMQN